MDRLDFLNLEQVRSLRVRLDERRINFNPYRIGCLDTNKKY
jgi:hypothetical protein